MSVLLKMIRVSTPPSGDADQCWLWQLGKTKDGYGNVYYEGRQHYVHRVALEERLGRPIVDGMIARHACGNRSCWNPDHILEGTHGDNARDRDAHGNTAKGERNGSFKVNDALRERIFEMRATGSTQQEIADTIGVAQSTVSAYLRTASSGGVGSHDESNPDRPHHPDPVSSHPVGDPRYNQLARDTRQQRGFLS